MRERSSTWSSRVRAAKSGISSLCRYDASVVPRAVLCVCVWGGGVVTGEHRSGCSPASGEVCEQGRGREVCKEGRGREVVSLGWEEEGSAPTTLANEPRAAQAPLRTSGTSSLQSCPNICRVEAGAREG